jgi:PAS domain S-box-containing protein
MSSDLLAHHTHPVETALLARELQYQTMLDSALDGFWVIDLQGRILDCNQACCELLGYDKTELLQHTIFDVAGEGAKEKFLARVLRIVTLGRERFETLHRRSDGRLIELEVSAHYVPHLDGRIYAFLHDITARKQAEVVQSRYALILQHARDAFLLITLDGRIIEANEAAQTLYHYTREQLLGLKIRDLRPDEAPEVIRHQMEEALASGVLFETWHKRKDGVLLPVEISSRGVQIAGEEVLLSVIRDISARKESEMALRQSEQQLRQAQKMAAIGTLAGGIAHDFNNMLFAITGFAAMALKQAENNQVLCGDLTQIMTASRHSSELVRQLLIFSRQTEQEHVAVAVTPIIKETCALLRATLPVTIHIALEIKTKHDVILTDPVQFQQIIMNLGTNACHAMRDRGGVMTLRLEEPGQVAHPEGVGAPEGWLRFSVQDTGCGIPSEHLERVFEPFFSTKAVGDGTGLGLSVVHGIVTASNGFIEVESTVEHGSTFKVYLPLLAATASAAEPKP